MFLKVLMELLTKTAARFIFSSLVVYSAYCICNILLIILIDCNVIPILEDKTVCVECYREICRYHDYFIE